MFYVIKFELRQYTIDCHFGRCVNQFFHKTQQFCIAGIECNKRTKVFTQK